MTLFNLFSSQKNHPDRVTSVALLLGTVTIVGTFIVGYQAYSHSRDTLYASIYESNLSLARTLRDTANNNANMPEHEILGALEKLWRGTGPRYEGSFMCIVNSDGMLSSHTGNPQKVGVSVDKHKMIKTSPDDPSTLGELVRSKKDWVGPYLSSSGEEQIAAFSYINSIKSSVALHVPYEVVNAQVQQAVLPWIIGFIFLGGGLIPFSMFLLHRAYSTSQKTLANTHMELRSSNEKLTTLAQFDELTGLVNRAHFHERLQQILEKSKSNGNKFALLFIDLDRFKDVNDTLGHNVGDQLLVSAAERLRNRSRKADVLARWGGDEFIIILDKLVNEQDASSVCQELINIIKPPFFLAGQEIYITTSIGIATYPDCGEDSATLIKNADIAMYQAKDNGRDTYQWYIPRSDAYGSKRLTLQSQLQHALERDEFELHYQPKINVHSRQVVGVEALLRWRQPDSSLLPPAEFIPLLEESGLIIPVGNWVLHTAMQEVKLWKNQESQPLHVAVNCSAYQFRKKELFKDIDRILKETGFNPDNLELEITEGILMEHDHNTMDIIKNIKALGVKIGIDDFGTGYSSLSYLKRFPIDTLKIDQEFIRDIGKDPDDTALVTTILALARNLQLKAVAEGVETMEQYNFLEAHACDEVQGFLICHPLPKKEFIDWLKNPETLMAIGS